MSLHEAMAAAAAASRVQTGTVQHAIVSNVDPTYHRVQVTVQPEGMVSGWIPDPGLAAAGMRISCPCEVGTQVLVAAAEGDAENPVIIARLFDLVAVPPVSPVTGKVAQAGELLAVSGQQTFQSNPGSTKATAPIESAAWYHLTPAGFYAGAGTMQLAITPNAITLTAGSSTLTLTEAALAAVGAAVSTDQDVTAGDISVKGHVHVDAGGSGLSGVPKQ